MPRVRPAPGPGSAGTRTSLAIGVAAIAVALPASAQAQTSGSLLVAPVLPPGFASVENQGVADRSRPEWQALGVRLGAFTLRPTASIAAGATSNAYLTRATPEESAVATGTAAFDLTSSWSRHYLSLRGTGLVNRYLGNSPADTTSWTLGASGRYDVHTSLQVAATGDVTRDNESRFEGEAVNSNFAVSPFIRKTGALRVSYNPGRLGLQLTTSYRHFHFMPVTFQGGARADQAFRDRTLTDATIQSTFARTPSFALFAQAAVSRTRFDVPDPVTLLQGNSEGVRILGGVNIELAGLITGSVGAGWSRRNYADPRIGTRSGLSVETRLELLPEEKTTITLTARRQLSDANPTSGPFWESVASVAVDREVRRNVIVGATAGYNRQQSIGDMSSDSRALSGGLTGVYLVSRRAEVRASMLYRSSDAQGLTKLTEQRGSIGLIFKL